MTIRLRRAHRAAPLDATLITGIDTCAAALDRVLAADVAIFGHDFIHLAKMRGVRPPSPARG